MAGPQIDPKEILRKLQLARVGKWLKGHAEKVVFWGLLGGLIYTCFLVWQSVVAPEENPLPQVSIQVEQTGETEGILKPPALRGYLPASQYAPIAMRNPFAICARIEVPKPPDPGCRYVTYVSEGKAGFEDENGGAFELDVGQSVGPWRLMKVEKEKTTFQTRYEHICELAFQAAPQVPPYPDPPKMVYQGRQKNEREEDCAWLAAPDNKTREALVPVKTQLSEGWILAEVHENHVVVRANKEHPKQPADIIWRYEDPLIPITYTGQSRFEIEGGKQFGHFTVKIPRRGGHVEERRRTATEGDMIKDTTFKLVTIAPDHVVVSRGDRQYSLKLTIERVENPGG